MPRATTPRRRAAAALCAIELEDRTNPVSFSPGSAFPSGAADPVRMIAADFNGDGVPDLAVAHQSSSTVDVFFGAGGGTFWPTPTVITAGLDHPSDIAAADLDLDGSPDLVVANLGSGPGTGGISIYHGSRGQRFSSPDVIPQAAGISFSAVRVGNFSNTTINFNNGGSYYGVPDIVGLDVSSGPESTARVYSALNGYTPAPPSAVTSGGAGGGHGVAAEFDGDGKLDFAGINRQSGTVFVEYGKGDGSFDRLFTDAAGGTPLDLVTGDFNGDGRPDLAASVLPTGGGPVVLREWLDTPGGLARQPDQALPAAADGALAAGDVDLDGKTDLLIGSTADQFVLLRGSATGTFTPDAGGPVATAADTSAVLAADVNADGRPDVVTLSGAQASVQPFVNASDLVLGTNLIPVVGAADLVYDDALGQLVVTTAYGRVERYDAATKTLHQAWQTDASLQGADVTPDGRYLYAAEASGNSFVKVDLATGAATGLTYTEPGTPTGGLWRALAIGPDGKALVTSPYLRTDLRGGYADLLQLDTATDTFSKRADGATAMWWSDLTRSADRKTVLVTERDTGGAYGNRPAGRITVYDQPTDTFTSRGGGEYLTELGAVSGDGSLFAVQGLVLDRGFNTHERLPYLARMAFDPTRHVAYGIDASTSEVVAVDTDTWVERYRLPLGGPALGSVVYGANMPVVSGDGRWLFVPTPDGIRVIDLPQAGGTPAFLALTTLFPVSLPAGTPGTLTVTVKDALGNVLADFAGTVTFTSSDPAAGLPAAYTFAPGDHGTKTFTLALNTVGTQSITLRDPADGLTTTEPGVQVNAPGLLPLLSFGTAVRDAVYDPIRNRVYFTVGGTVQRFDINTQALLAPFNVGTRLAGADISPDGRYLYAPETGFTYVQQLLRKVDLETGTSQLIPYGHTDQTVGGSYLWDVAVVGKYVLGVGDSALLRFDRTTNALSYRDGEPAEFGTTMIARSADGQTAFFEEPSVGVGRQIFSAADDRVIATRFDGFIAPANIVAVNRNGTLVATDRNYLKVYDRGLNPVTAPSVSGTNGVIFHPTADRVFVTTLAGGGDLEAYDTATWQQAWAVPYPNINRDAYFSTGMMALSVDGRFLYSTNGNQVLQTDLIGRQSKYAVTAQPSAVTAGQTVRITVTVRDGNGMLLPGYFNRVQLAVSDPQATGLPTEYTFSPADNGTKTFFVTLRTAGVTTITVSDPSGLFADGTATITVSAAAPDRLTLTGLPGAVTAGTGAGFTVSAYDAFGNPATRFTGTVTFASTDPQATLPVTYRFTAGTWTHDFTATLRTAGPQTITVTDAADGLSAFGTVTVTPAGAAALVALAPSAVTAGSPFGLVVTAYDPFGNVATGYAGTVSLSSSDPLAGLPAGYTFGAGDAGTHPFTVTLKTAGTQTVTAADGGGTVSAGSASVTVAPGSAVRFTADGLPQSVTAGVANPWTVTAYDPFNNIATRYVGTVHFTSTDPRAVLPADYTFRATDLGRRTFPVTLVTAGAQAVTVQDTAAPALTATQAGITVGPGGAAAVTVSGLPPTVTAGQTVGLTVTVLDAFGNVATGYTGTVTFASTDPLAGLPAGYTFTLRDAGTRTFPVTLKTAGPQTVTVAVAGVTATAGATVTPAAATWFDLTGFPPAVTAGVPFGFTVTAYDPYGNVATGYVGTVAFTSTDPRAALPADATFTPADQGVRAFTATLTTAGPQVLAAGDPAGPVAGRVTVPVSPAAAAALVVAGPPGAVTAGAPVRVTVTAYDRFGNVATGFTGAVVLTAGDSRAGLPPAYTFGRSDAGTAGLTLTLWTAGSWAVTAAAGGLSPGTATVTVIPAPAVRLALDGVPGAVTAGDPLGLTLTAFDPYGNVATGYAGTVALASTDPNALLPAAVSFAAGGGRVAVPAALRTAGTRAITATDPATGLAAAVTGVVVLPAAATGLVLATPAGPVPAGTQLTVVITAEDAYGNAATGYAGTVGLSASDGRAQYPAGVAFRPDDAGVRAVGLTYLTAGPEHLTAAAGGLAAGGADTVVVPAATSRFALAGLPASVPAGGTVAFTVTALDAFGNATPGYAGTVTVGSDDARATLPAAAGLAAGTGTFAVTLRTAGPRWITVGDGTTEARAAVTVTPGPVAALAVTAPAAVVATGDTVAFAVTALDAFGNATPDTTGLVRVTVSDPRAAYPPTIALSGGAGQIPVTFRTPGRQTVTAAGDPPVTGAAAGITVEAAPGTGPTIAVIADRTVAAGRSTGPIPVTIGDDRSRPDDLVLSATSSDSTLVPPAGVVLGGSGADRTVTVTPASGMTGTATITVTVRGGDGLTAARSFAVHVTPAGTRGGLPREFAVGAGAGGGPGVQFYNPDGTLRFTATPFDPSVTGGVRTAAADFNGDGIADLVVGTGPGGPSHVAILDGKDQHVLFSLDPFEASFTGGVYVAAGDVTGDGVPDLVVTPDEGGGPRVRVFDGANGFAPVIDFYGIDAPAFRGGARAAVGDVNGDGVGDLVVAAGYLGGPRVAGYDGTSLGSGTPVKIFADFYAFEPTLRNGVFLAVGDVTGDGYADVIAGGGPGGGPRVTIFSGKALLGNQPAPVADFFAGDPANRGGVRLAVKDLDGDNKADLVVGSGDWAGSRVTGYAGKALGPGGTAATAFDFDAFPGFGGGVFVG